MRKLKMNCSRTKQSGFSLRFSIDEIYTSADGEFIRQADGALEDQSIFNTFTQS